MEQTDEQRVTASRQGDREAFSALIRQHMGRVYALCFGILSHPAESEDLVQETFLKAYRSIDSLRDPAQLANWIDQIARNLCRDQLRRRKRHLAYLQDEIEVRGGPTGPHQDHANAGVTPPSIAHDDLRRALAQLPEQHRVPLMLFYFDGQSTAKLAEVLEISPAGACTRLSRARRELRKLMGEEDNQP